MKYVDCKAYAQEILDEVKAIPNKKELWILTMGNDPASQSYVKGKIKDCEYCGVPYSHIQCNTEDALRNHIVTGNVSKAVGGIIVQLPLPEGVHANAYIHGIATPKDVDGFKDSSLFEPCTPEGIMYILGKELGDLTGKRVLVIGRGNLVGAPLARMLLAADCTVTVAHSKTTNLDELVKSTDVIVCAVGKPRFLDLSKCKAEIVIDVGVNQDKDGKLCGDCFNFHPYENEDMKVTPVPGGIGLMTRAMLMKHMSEV